MRSRYQAQVITMFWSDYESSECFVMLDLAVDQVLIYSLFENKSCLFNQNLPVQNTSAQYDQLYASG